MPNLPLPIEAPAAPSICTLYHGDCLEVMPTLASNSVAMVFSDLPYTHKSKSGVVRKATENFWDIPFALPDYFASVARLEIKGCVQIFTATQPFASYIITAHPSHFRHDLIWDKTRASSFANARRAPMRCHEHVLVFAKGPLTYNPQMTHGHPASHVRKNNRNVSKPSTSWSVAPKNVGTSTVRYPLSILRIKREDMRFKRGHPTQKPVALLEWLIATYTNPGDTVLDPVFGSNSTGVACARLGRNYVGIEKDAEYFRLGTERVNAERARLGLAPLKAIPASDFAKNT